MNIFDTHSWIGTQHCLREKDGDGYQCCNDHTGCLWNDGHNTCMFEEASNKTHDSPLLKKDRLRKPTPSLCSWYGPVMTSAHRVYSARNGQED